MKPISPEIKILYDAALIKKGIPLPAHFHYRKWLRYYLDFCLRYHHKPANKESFAPFVQRLKDKKQTEQQRKQASDAISLFCQMKKADQGKTYILKNNEGNISTKKAESPTTSYGCGW